MSALVGCHGASAPRTAYFDEDHVETINGTRLHYRVRGWNRNHPYLLVLHGGPGSSAFEFYPWGEALEREINVIYLDQRGCGQSEHARFAATTPTAAEAAPFSFANLVRDLEGVREHLRIDRWYVLGHSFGGMYGIEYVLAHPERVIAYIHMSGLLSVPMIDEDWLVYAKRSLAETARLDPNEQPRINEVRTAIAKLYSMPQVERDARIGPLVIDKLRPEMTRDRFDAANTYDGRIDAEVVRRYKVSPELFGSPEPRRALAVIEHFATRDIVDALPRISRPTLILGGAQDPIVPPNRNRLAHERIPRSQLLIVDRAGHEIYKDQPRATAEAVLAFVRANP